MDIKNKGVRFLSKIVRVQLSKTILSLAGWLKHHFPTAYRIARPAWRAFMKRLPKLSYWEDRRNFNYYQEVLRLAKVYASSGGQVIDVGTNEAEVLQKLAWFRRRVALDKRHIPPQPGIETVMMDFMDYQPVSEFDLVICLQVLEHLPEPDVFARKLLDTGRTIIISVPYKWPKGACKYHLQDPVDEEKLEMWTKRKPVAVSVVADRKERLVAVYQNQDVQSVRRGVVHDTFVDVDVLEGLSETPDQRSR